MTKLEGSYPTVFREDYLLSLRKLSRKLDPAPYVRMLPHAQQFTASISYEDYSHALAQLQACNAFLESDEGKLIDHIRAAVDLTSRD